MAAAWVVALHELRKRWGAQLALMGLIAVAGGVMIASAAGASRTSTSYDRFLAQSPTPDVFVGGLTPDVLGEIAELPEVDASAVVAQMSVLVADPDKYYPFAAAVDMDEALELDRSRLLEGRLPRPEAIDEVALNERQAEGLEVEVGDTFRVNSFTPEEVELEMAGQPHDATGPALDLRVVGITRSASDLAVGEDDLGLIVLTPAFYQEHRDAIGSFSGMFFVATLTDGRASLPAFRDGVRRIVGDGPPPQFEPTTTDTSAVNSSIAVLTVGLTLFSLAAGLAALVTIAVATARHVFAEANRDDQLRAVGMTRPERMAALLLPRFLTGSVGAALAVALAVALSPFFPIGLARRAEPDPGVDVNVAALAIGFAVIVLAVAVLTLGVAWRMT
ncbi:MAG TPA: hypothetical protein VD926_10490, partial [Acidimicrobiales bacterium]|nr:hypothetical protein [Acidimicrobiales bacterium]